LKKKDLILKMVIVILVVSLLTIFFYEAFAGKTEFSGAESIQTIDARFIVGDRVGLNADKDVLDFGIIMPGSSAIRSINVTNTHPYNITVRLYSSGNISKFIRFDGAMLVAINETKEIFLGAYVPSNATFESYSGDIKVAFFPS